MNHQETVGPKEDLFYPVAANLARQGATRGMILGRLREEKLDQWTAERLADRALHEVATKRRFRGFGVCIGGLAIIGVALALLGSLPANLSAVLGMLGLIIFGLGGADVAHRVKLPKESGNFHSRVR